MIRDSRTKHWRHLCIELEENIGDAYKFVAQNLKQLTHYKLSLQQKKELIANMFPTRLSRYICVIIEKNLTLVLVSMYLNVIEIFANFIFILIKIIQQNMSVQSRD